MDFKEIYIKNKRNIKNIIRILTKEDNEDLEQEVYLKIWKNSKMFEPASNVKSLINTITKNATIDFVKSKSYKNSKLEEKDEYILENLHDKKSSVESELISLERQKRILYEIERLKPKLKEVIILTEFEGKSYEDCSKILKCPIGTIKSRIYNAKKELAQKLEDIL